MHRPDEIPSEPELDGDRIELPGAGSEVHPSSSVPTPPGSGHPSVGIPPEAWERRWHQLASAAHVGPDEPLLLALSGGADSVLLLHLLAAARPRPRMRAAHVNHALRGDESLEDEAFCRRLCASLGIPFVALAAPVEDHGLLLSAETSSAETSSAETSSEETSSEDTLAEDALEQDVPGHEGTSEAEPSSTRSLEARAREARYRALCAEARSGGELAILTGHHADDALETVLLRWIRGTQLSGLFGPHRESQLAVGSGFDALPSSAEDRPDGEAPSSPAPLKLVRPLLSLRREEVRRLLLDRGLAWREDRSNLDQRFARNRVRHALLPAVKDLCGEEGIENLRRFAGAVERLELELAGATAHLQWQPLPHESASRSARSARLGGALQRGALMELSASLRQRALWRLLGEGPPEPPGRSLAGLILADLARGRCARHTLPGGWTLVMRSSELLLLPPASARASAQVGPAPLADGPHARQLFLPFPGGGAADGSSRRPAIDSDLSPFGLEERPAWTLPVPGVVSLPDGRRLVAELLDKEPGSGLSLDPRCVELDASGLASSQVGEAGPWVTTLEVRFPRSGDRFRGLGAPGSKLLRRFLADAGVPREERAHVPLICSAGEILWVVGVRPAERHRVRSETRLRLSLSLLDAAWTPVEDESSPDGGQASCAQSEREPA